MVSMIPVKAEDFEDWRERTSWHFDSFAERSRGEISVNELHEEVTRKHRQLWVVTKQDEIVAVVLTRILPKGVVEITQCAGVERDDWAILVLQTVGAWAYELGATRLRIIHRPGWSRFLRKAGFKQTHVASEIDWEKPK